MQEKGREKAIRIIFKIISFVTIVVSIAIIASLIAGVIPFVENYSMVDFLNPTTKWSPNTGEFGVFPLIIGTLKVVIVAIVIAIPLGLFSAIYLSEYATPKVRNILKPILEILAGIPSIVYGIFAYSFINPIVGDSAYSSLGAGIAMAFMLIPMIASLSEDVLRSIPNNIREGAIGVGSTKQEMITKILLPAGLSGIMASFILAISRALGETMIVALAAGNSPASSLDLTQGGLTMTGAIMMSTGTDASFASLEYTSLYAIAILLFILTLGLNLISKKVINKYKIDYN